MLTEALTKIHTLWHYKQEICWYADQDIMYSTVDLNFYLMNNTGYNEYIKSAKKYYVV